MGGLGKKHAVHLSEWWWWWGVQRGMKGGECFPLRNGSVIIQIIAQIIIISENLPNKGSQLKNCFLLSKWYYRQSRVGRLRFCFCLLFCIKQRNVHIMLTVAAVCGALTVNQQCPAFLAWKRKSETAMSVIKVAIWICSVMSPVTT